VLLSGQNNNDADAGGFIPQKSEGMQRRLKGRRAMTEFLVTLLGSLRFSITSNRMSNLETNSRL
jgi:hypothetical protein